MLAFDLLDYNLQQQPSVQQHIIEHRDSLWGCGDT